MKTGVVKAPGKAGEVPVVLERNVLPAGEPVVGRILCARVGDVLVVLRVEDFETKNPFASEPVAVLRSTELLGEEGLAPHESVILRCSVMSAFVKRDVWRRVPPGIPVPSGTEVFLPERELKEIFEGKEGVVFVGKTSGIDVPLHLVDFRKLNEAFHFVVVGATGSGKTTEAKKIITGYAKVAPEMNFLILDPQGEFTRNFLGRPDPGFPLDMGAVWRGLGREFHLVDVDGITLRSWEEFEKLLVLERFFWGMRIQSSENQTKAARLTVEYLSSRHGSPAAVEVSKMPLDLFTSSEFTGMVYSSGEKREDVLEALNSPATRERLEKHWFRIWSCFNEGVQGRLSAKRIAEMMVREKGKTVVINTSTLNWNNPLKAFNMKAVVEALIEEAERNYREGNMTGCLVVLDEAHRVIPATASQEPLSDVRKELRARVLTALRETRKFGVGWMIISTSLTNIDKEALRSCRVRFFGAGLGFGADAEAIKEICGSDALRFYRLSVGDPMDPLGEKSHQFFVHGPVTLISRSFPEVYTSYAAEEFLKANGFEERFEEKEEDDERLFESLFGGSSAPHFESQHRKKRK